MLLHSPKLLSNYVALLKMHIALNNCSRLQQMLVFIQLAVHRRASLLKHGDKITLSVSFRAVELHEVAILAF